MIGAVVLAGSGPAGATGVVTVGLDEAVFAGHYPGFPVLPGVYLIELVRDTLDAWLGDVGALIMLERSRFHRPVRPGDEVTAAVSVVYGDGELVCTAVVSVPEGKAADLRLRFRTEVAP